MKRLREGPTMPDKNHRHSERSGSLLNSREVSRHLWEIVRRAFIEFLMIPTVVIGGFLLVALLMFIADEARIADEGPASQTVWGGLFTDAEASRAFLGVIAASIVTVTSITLSLLLIAVQQGAASLTSLVFDQFLRRRANQLYFGFFLGLALYSLIVLASINPSHQPVYGVALAGLMTAVALYMLIILIYTTINQMRPVVIIKSIHDHALLARQCQVKLLRSTRRVPRLQAIVGGRVTADRGGFLVRLDVAAIVKASTDTETEVVIQHSIGDYVACGDLIAEIRTASGHRVSSLEAVIRGALVLEDQRDLDTDPSYGVEQLVTIGWTSISTAKSNPGPGLLAIWNLRDLLARWLQSDDAFASGGSEAVDQESPVVYSDDLSQHVMRGFESLVVSASESMQHQCAAEIYLTFANLFHRMSPAVRRQAEDLLLRSLSGLGDHILTSTLDASLSALIDVLSTAGRSQCASAVDAARCQLGQSVGRLNSRSTRTRGGE